MVYISETAFPRQGVTDARGEEKWILTCLFWKTMERLASEANGKKKDDEDED